MTNNSLEQLSAKELADLDARRTKTIAVKMVAAGVRASVCPPRELPQEGLLADRQTLPPRTIACAKPRFMAAGSLEVTNSPLWQSHF